jgi:hypothetical protein
MSRINVAVMESSWRSSPIESAIAAVPSFLGDPGKLSDRKQRFPDILSPVAQLFRKQRCAGRELVHLRLEPLGELIAPRVSGRFDLSETEALDDALARAPLEPDRNRAIRDRVRERVTDAGERLGAED